MIRRRLMIVAWTTVASLLMQVPAGPTAARENGDSRAKGEADGVLKAYPLVPVSGADGAFESIQADGGAWQRGSKQAGGDYPPYMYFRVPESLPKPQQTVYVEVVLLDAVPEGAELKGNSTFGGRLGLQYNGTNGENYRNADSGHGRLLTGQGQTKTAVFQLSTPEFRRAQNLQADLRLTNPDRKSPLQVQSATLYLAPTPLFERLHSQRWLSPYNGPTAEKAVDTTSLHKKVLCGYQGWFRARGDEAEGGWGHWSRNPNRVAADSLTVEMWPDLSEFTDEEKFLTPGLTHPDGSQAYLFSSIHPKTIDRHFDWMAQYGIDGVLIQRFVGGLANPAEASRVLGYARASANRTGRVFAVEYDMSGVPADRLYDRLVSDWKWLVDEMKITSDSRYLHHDGKPVLAVWGFYSDRFKGDLANQIIDFFKDDPKYRVCVIGGCQWYWRNEKDADWARAFRRFDVISPWNVGHTAKKDGHVHAATHEWKADLEEASRAKMLYLPVIYPGFSWDNLQRKPVGSTNIPRLKGEFFWRQFVTVADLGLDMAKVAMFDEVDEGTAIFKVSNNPPTQGHFVTLENLPSDWYLRLTGEGTRMLRKERPMSKRIPIQP